MNINMVHGNKDYINYSDEELNDLFSKCNNMLGDLELLSTLIREEIKYRRSNKQ